MPATPETVEFPTPPAVLYKYRTVCDYTKRILENNQLWYSSVVTLNDPFDCCFTAKPHRPTRDIIDCDRNQFRVTSFSETNDNLIMWAHYGDYHRGLCLGFTFPPEQHSSLWRVEYFPDLPCHSDECSGASFIRAVVTTKSVEWQYEREWRRVAKPAFEKIMSHSSEGMVLPFPPQWLSEVCIGARMSQADKDEIIRLVLNRKDPNLRLYIAKQDVEKYRLLIERIA